MCEDCAKLHQKTKRLVCFVCFVRSITQIRSVKCIGYWQFHLITFPFAFFLTKMYADLFAAMVRCQTALCDAKWNSNSNSRLNSTSTSKKQSSKKLPVICIYFFYIEIMVWCCTLVRPLFVRQICDACAVISVLFAVLLYLHSIHTSCNVYAFMF